MVLLIPQLIMSAKNKSYELSIAELKKYPGFENISDDEAQHTIQQLKELSFILYDAFQNQQHKEDKIESFKNENDEK